MSEQNKNTEMPLAMKDVFNELQSSGDFEIKPCKVTNIEDNPKYKKLDLTRNQQMRMSGFASQLPMIFNAASGAAMANALSDSTYYVMSVPNGIPYTLSNLKDGFDNSLRGADGKYTLKLPLYQVDISETVKLQTAVLSTFTAMSIATGQYFLSEINNKLNVIQASMDDILKFLYGDKKAELLSEINFVRYVYKNYNSIMQNDIQRTATITSLQESRKIAFKDCEFYLSDLEYAVNASGDICKDIKKTFDFKEVLDLALSLYVTSNLLEVYYSQNFNKEYLSYVEKDITSYIEKYNLVVHGAFKELLKRIDNTNDHPIQALNWVLPDRDRTKKKINAIIDGLRNGSESDLRKMFRSSLRMPTERKDYYISPNGEVYVKIS